LQLVNERREEALIKAAFHKFHPMGRLNSRGDCVLATAHGTAGYARRVRKEKFTSARALLPLLHLAGPPFFRKERFKGL